MREDLVNAYRCIIQRMGPHSLQWQDKGQQAQTKHRKFDLNKRKNLRVTEHWSRLPIQVVKSSALEIFKTHLEWVPLFRMTLNYMTFSGPLRPSPFCDCVKGTVQKFYIRIHKEMEQ